MNESKQVRIVTCSDFPYDKAIEAMDVENTQSIRKLVNRFPTEENENTYDYCNEALANYIYIPKHYTLWVGRYVRYLDCTNALQMKLRVGGIVMKDNTFSVTLKQNNRVFTVNKRNRLWFLLPNDADNRRIMLAKMLH